MNHNIDATTLITDSRLLNAENNFIDFFPSSVLLLNENLVVINANNNALDLFCTSKELIGKNISEIISKNEFDKLFFLLKKSFSSAKQYSTEIKIKTSDNRVIDSLAMIGSFTSSEIDKKFCVMAIYDMTNQRMKEEIIKDSEARFKEMANTAPVMIWIADVEGLFSFVNKVWLEYSGGEIGNQLGMNWLNQVHPDDLKNLINNYQNAYKNKESFSVEFRFNNFNNKYKWMLLKGKPRFGQGNIYMGFIGSCINIQEQKDIESKISKLNEELSQTVKSRDKFFSIISHDLRSPLSGLMGILDILNSSYETMDDVEKKEIISDATVVSRTTYTLLENLLEWSRIQTGSIYYNPENLILHRLIDNISALYAQNMKDKEIGFLNNIKPDHLVYADKSMTETILRNLISNAIKFSYRKGVIKILSIIKNDFLVVCVQDSGLGLDDDTQNSIFKSDTAISTKGTEKESGTGLGLVICKEFVEKQSGKIWVKSKKNEGATFYFSLPLAK